MGNNNNHYSTALPHEHWHQQPSPTPHNLYQNTDHPAQWIEEYDICIDDENVLARLCDVYEWRKDGNYVITSQWLQLEDKGEVCSTLHKGKLYLEHMPITLCDVTDIPYPDVLHLYHQVLQGCLLLSRRIGYFRVSQDCIGINMKGVAKVWFHHNYDRTKPYATTTKEWKMLENVVQVIESNTNLRTLPPNIPTIGEYLLQHDKISLIDAVRRVKEYALTYCMGNIPSHLQCVMIAGGPAQIRLSCQQAHQIPITYRPEPQLALQELQQERIEQEKINEAPGEGEKQITNQEEPLKQGEMKQAREQAENTEVKMVEKSNDVEAVEAKRGEQIERQPKKTEPISEPSTYEALQSRTTIPSGKPVQTQSSLPLNSTSPPIQTRQPIIPLQKQSSHHSSQKQLIIPRPSDEGGSSSMSSLGVSNVPNRTTKEYSDKMFSEIKQESIHNSTRNFYNQYVTNQSNYEDQPRAQVKPEGFSFGNEGTAQELLTKLKNPLTSSPSNQYGNYGTYNTDQYTTSPVIEKQTYYQPEAYQAKQYNYNSKPQEKAQYFSSYKYEPQTYPYTTNKTYEYKSSQQPYQYKPAEQYQYKSSQQPYQYKSQQTQPYKYTNQSYPYQYTTQKYTQTSGGKYETNDGYDVEWDPDILADIKANVHKQ